MQRDTGIEIKDEEKENQKLNDFERVCNDNPQIMPTIIKYLSTTEPTMDVLINNVQLGTRPFFETTSTSVTNEQLKEQFILFQELIIKKLTPIIEAIYKDDKEAYTNGLKAISDEIRKVFEKDPAWEKFKKDNNFVNNKELEDKLINIVAGAMMYKMMDPWLVAKLDEAKLGGMMLVKE